MRCALLRCAVMCAVLCCKGGGVNLATTLRFFLTFCVCNCLSCRVAARDYFYIFCLWSLCLSPERKARTGCSSQHRQCSGGVASVLCAAPEHAAAPALLPAPALFPQLLLPAPPPAPPLQAPVSHAAPSQQGLRNRRRRGLMRGWESVRAQIASPGSCSTKSCSGAGGQKCKVDGKDLRCPLLAYERCSRR